MVGFVVSTARQGNPIDSSARRVTSLRVASRCIARAEMRAARLLSALRISRPRARHSAYNRSLVLPYSGIRSSTIVDRAFRSIARSLLGQNRFFDPFDSLFLSPPSSLSDKAVESPRRCSSYTWFRAGVYLYGAEHRISGRAVDLNPALVLITRIFYCLCEADCY